MDINKLDISDYEVKIPDLNITISVGLDGGDHLHLSILPDNEDYYYHQRIIGMHYTPYYGVNLFKLSDWINDCIKKGYFNLTFYPDAIEMIVWDEKTKDEYLLRRQQQNDFW